MTDLHQAIISALEDWQGWPELKWLVSSVARKTHRTNVDVDQALKELYLSKRVTKHEYKTQIVFHLT